MPNKLTVFLVDDHALARPPSRRTATPSWAKKKNRACRPGSLKKWGIAL